MCFMNRVTSTLKLSKFVRRRDFISRTLLVSHGQYDTSQKIIKSHNASNISKGTSVRNLTLPSKLLYVGNISFRRGLKSKNDNLCPLGTIETFLKGSDTPMKVLVTIPYESITNNEVNVDKLVTSLHSLQNEESTTDEADKDLAALKQSLLTEASRQTGLEFENFQSFEFVKIETLEKEADAIGTLATSKDERQYENESTMSMDKNEANFICTDSPIYGNNNLAPVGASNPKIPKILSNMMHSYAINDISRHSKKYSTFTRGENSMKIEASQNVYKIQLDQVRNELTRLLEMENQLVQILAKDPCKKGDDPCKKKEDPCKKKEDPCKKKEDPCKKKEDPCKKKEDPCKKKEDPCKKKEDPCKKKEDPCKKKEDPCKKKEDPCKKKEDPCKKKEDPCKKKEDPCKKKEDPCKKKEDPCKKKEDPCKKKEDPCKKKEDPCKKKEDPCKKKEDPCKKKKPSGPCKKKEDPCKKDKKRDPCEEKIRNLRKNAPKRKDPCKKKEDPCKKKEDPCKKRENPCKRKPKKDDCKKEDPCKKKEPKKKDPCKKEKKEDPCKKKEDPCKKKEDPCKKKEDPCKKKEDPCKKKCSGTETNSSSYTSNIFGIMHNSFNNKQPSARALHNYQKTPAKLAITRRFSSYVPSKVFQKHHSFTKKSMACQPAENTGLLTALTSSTLEATPAKLKIMRRFSSYIGLKNYCDHHSSAKRCFARQFKKQTQ